MTNLPVQPLQMNLDAERDRLLALAEVDCINTDDISALCDNFRDMAALIRAQAAEIERLRADAAAHKWGYEYLQDRMRSIGRDGWASDCDGEIEARINAAIAAERKGGVVSVYCTPETRQKARKPHRCNWCGEAIEIGTEYARWYSIVDGDGATNRAHVKRLPELHEECAANGGEYLSQ